MNKNKRLTMHSGRKGKNGLFSSKHNDRNFETGAADNIDPGRTGQNRYWMCDKKSKTFEECEERFYAEHFGELIRQRNEAAEHSRHPERRTSAEKLRKSEKSAPDEIIYQIGTKDGHVTPETLGNVFRAFRKWRKEHFPLVHTLDLALHLDESTPHIHERVVWIAHDGKTGREVPNQSAALREMGVERPEPDKPESRYNNAKMTYTEACRSKLQEICRAHGIELLTEPAEPGKRTLDLMIWQARQEEKRLKDLKKQLSACEDSLKRLTKTIDALLQTAERDRDVLYPEGVTVKEAPLSRKKEVRGVTPEMWEERWASANARADLRQLGKEIKAGLAQIRASVSGEMIAALEKELHETQVSYAQLSRDAREMPTYAQGADDVLNAVLELFEAHPQLKQYLPVLENNIRGTLQSKPEEHDNERKEPL